ncbi:unnamed protein product [Sphagnum tenellum]
MMGLCGVGTVVPHSCCCLQGQQSRCVVWLSSSSSSYLGFLNSSDLLSSSSHNWPLHSPLRLSLAHARTARRCRRVGVMDGGLGKRGRKSMLLGAGRNSRFSDFYVKASSIGGGDNAAGVRAAGDADTEGRVDTVAKMSWLGQVFSRKSKEEEVEAQEEQAELFAKIGASEKKRVTDMEELGRLAEVQMERSFVQQTMWMKILRKLQGELRGTMWDPFPAEDITYAAFLQLLEAKKVQFLDYGEFGRYLAVILPYYDKQKDQILADESGKQTTDEVPQAEESSKSSLANSMQPDDTRKIVFKRHIVENVPADGWNDVWKQLHTQLVNVEVHNLSSLPVQLYPTFATALVWGMRLVLAVTVFRWLDGWLYPIYKMKNPNDRPVSLRPKLSNDMNAELGALGQSRARFISAEASTGVTFDDFAGQEYVKRELQEVVKILKDSKEFEDLGIYCPKGVLLYGPPGTGKTLLAKAIAGEAGVPFFSASGAEFVEMFVGVAAARVRDLFARARQFAPSIVFIDEIDAIGAKRGGPDVGGGGVEREQGLIQILTELDGFQSQGSKVLVVGATNRLDMLDPALLRKGRFDKTISIGLPTEEGRLAILNVHARNKGFKSEQEKELLLTELAGLTFDYSGAELQNILNEAAILAARKDKDIIERPEILEALKRQEGKFTTGEEDVVDATGEARMRIAYREAASALLECYLPNPHRPFTKTNIRDIDVYPNIEFEESRHRVFARKSDLVDSIVRACAPRLVEELVFGRDNLSWMSGSALSEAGLLADYMIFRTGMTALGKIYYRTQQDVMVHIGPKVQALRDEYMRFAVEKCSAVLREYRSALETIAQRLLEKEEVEASEVWDIYRKAPRIPQPEIRPVDEHGVLLYAGRWGIHGVTLPGRVTFAPGKVGWATFGAPRPRDLKSISNETWKMLDKIKERNLAELAKEDEDDVEEIGEVVFPQQFL